jgi:hypothetical protein
LFVFGRPNVVGRAEFESLSDQAVAAGLKKPYYVFIGWIATDRPNTESLRELGRFSFQCGALPCLDC